MHESSNVSWQILTDGIITSNIYDKNDQNTSGKNPAGNLRFIDLIEAKIRTIKVDDANFVIEQGLINSYLKKINIYTNIFEQEELKQIVNWGNIEYTLSDQMTTEEPYVYSLKKTK